MLKKIIGITAIIFNKFKYLPIFIVSYYSNKIGKELFDANIECRKLEIQK